MNSDAVWLAHIAPTYYERGAGFAFDWVTSVVPPALVVCHGSIDQEIIKGAWTMDSNFATKPTIVGDVSDPTWLGLFDRELSHVQLQQCSDRAYLLPYSHLPHPVTFRSLARWLRPGGTLVITNFHSLWSARTRRPVNDFLNDLSVAKWFESKGFETNGNLVLIRRRIAPENELETALKEVKEQVQLWQQYRQSTTTSSSSDTKELDQLVEWTMLGGGPTVSSGWIKHTRHLSPDQWIELLQTIYVYDPRVLKLVESAIPLTVRLFQLDWEHLEWAIANADALWMELILENLNRRGQALQLWAKNFLREKTRQRRKNLKSIKTLLD